MLNHPIYHLMQQLVEESQNLWHIKEHYLPPNQSSCEGCRDIWKNFVLEKESNLEILMQHIKYHSMND